MKLHLRRKISLLLALVLTLGCAAPVSTTVKAEEGYSVTVSASATEVKPGDTVSLTATVTKGEEEITDLAGEGLYLWWWTDVWNYSDGNSDSAYSNYDGDSGLSLTADVTLPSEGTYYIVAELQDSSYSDVADRVTITITVAEGEAEMADLTSSLTNPDFETGDSTGWTLSGFSSVATDSWNTANTT